MKRLVPAAPIFGFYGGGEIGAARVTDVPRGVGFHVAAAVLFRE